MIVQIMIHVILWGHFVNLIVFMLYKGEKQKWFHYTMLLGIISILTIVGILALTPIKHTVPL